MNRQTYKDFQAVIYDVDDTLLDNHSADFPYGMHEYSRFMAIQQIGRELGLSAFEAVTHEQNAQSFLNASEHSVEGALWRLMADLQLVDGAIQHDHDWVRRIVARKARLHEELLATNSSEVNGASHFVRTMGQHGVMQAIASGALRSEIAIFLHKYSLETYFPEKHSIAKGDYEHAKPHPESFERAFQTLSLLDTPASRAQVIAFEDDPKGIESAKRAGLFVCALTTRFSADILMEARYRPDLIARDFEEYADIFQIT